MVIWKATSSSLSFDTIFINLFFRWGLIVHNLRWILFILPFVLTTFLGLGFLWIKEQTTIDPQFIFSPEDANWRYERRILSQNWPLDEQHFWPGKSYDYNGYVDVIIAGRVDPDSGYRPNILLQRYINEIDRLNKYIIHNLTVSVDHGNNSYSVNYVDLCMSYDWKCYLNEHLIMLQPKSKWANFENPSIAEFAKDIIESEVKVTYPIGWRGTEPIYFGALVSGVHLTDVEGHFDYAKAVRLTYNVRDGTLSKVSYKWRKKLADYLVNLNEANTILDIGFYHNESLPEGLQDVADTLAPKFVICTFILLALCVFCSIVLLSDEKTLKIVGIDWLRSKPILGVAALVCPLLSVISGFGILLWMGVFYNAIVNVSPFIVLCIGIDDAFLMSAAWHRTNPQLSVARRLAETLAEAAVAISITSITDMLTFGIGCFTTLPGVRLFCMYTFWGIIFTYIYQITYFSAVIAIAGEMENCGQHALFGCKTLQLDKADTSVKRLTLAGSICRMDKKILQQTFNEPIIEKMQIKSHHDRETLVNRLFREVYGPILLTKRTKLYVLGVFLIYFTGAIYGLSQIKEGLNPKNLVRSSFYLTNFYELIDETFWIEGLQMQVVINKPPDFFDFKQRARFSKLLTSFEGTHFTMHHNATMLWLNAYESYLIKELKQFNISLPNTSDEWYFRCKEWLLIAGGGRLWELDMMWDNNSTGQGHNNLKAFRFQIGLRNYRTPTDHTESCKLMREISNRFLEFNVTTFHEYYPFADQYLELKPALYRNCVLAVLCMAFVSFIMIPNLGAAFVIVAAIVSIDIGVLGYMTLWGVNFESVSMITVIMSIGFSVDLSAHITYGYVKASKHLSSNEKALAALETVGWPVFLGAFSTIVGIMVLTLVDAYIVQIFFKTIFLVISFSLLHGIVFLPIFLTVTIGHFGILKRPEIQTSCHISS